jgi:hypothetical protein
MQGFVQASLQRSVEENIQGDMLLAKIGSAVFPAKSDLRFANGYLRLQK